MASKVFYSSARVREYRTWWLPQASMLRKMEKVFYESGLNRLCKGKVAIKMHMGEPGDTHYIRPIYATTLVDLVRREGGEPVLVETSGMGWLANRTSANRYLEAARRNGFARETVGADIRMLDGVLGLDTIPGSIVAKGLRDFDSLLVLSHVTGHLQAGFGGAIKNLGLGCVAKQGKYRVHHTGRPRIDRAVCTRCDACVQICPVHAIEGYAVDESCISCSLCLDVCEPKALRARYREPVELTRMVAENAAEVLRHVEKAGFINLAIDVLPHCDCHPFSDLPMVPDIGVLASLDAVAIDRASVDLVNSSPGNLRTSADDASALALGSDKFNAVNPSTSWKAQLERAEELGMGVQRYELMEVR